MPDCAGGGGEVGRRATSRFNGLHLLRLGAFAVLQRPISKREADVQLLWTTVVNADLGSVGTPSSLWRGGASATRSPSDRSHVERLRPPGWTIWRSPT